jgi:predicted RNA-binding Zn ribbon-like protein
LDVTLNIDLWLDLLNSDWHDHSGSGRREDRLDDPRWLKAFLSRGGLDLGAAAGQRAVRSLRGLRNVIRRIADKYAARLEVPDNDWDSLNAYLDRVPIVRRVTVSGGKPEMIQISRGDKLEAALAAIAGSFAETVVQEDPSRIKVCRNKDCLWVFFDRSKNRSRRWCENTCGNLMKVRRFRQRRRAIS